MSPIAYRLRQDVARHQRQDPSFPIHFVNELNRFPGGPVEVSLAWEELLACGIVVRRWKNPEGMSGGNAQDSFYVTPRGHDWLRVGGASPSPEDPDAFLAALKADDNLDPFISAAVAEAVWAYGHQRPVSALVCLCAAAERMVRIVDDATNSPNQDNRIAYVFASLDKRITGSSRKKAEVIQFFATTFTAIRDARNKVAHRGTITELAEVRQFLLQYLAWHKAAAALRDCPAC